MHSMADAPFYKAILDREDVSLVRNCSECVQSVSDFLSRQDAAYTLPTILNDDIGTAIKNITTVIESR